MSSQCFRILFQQIKKVTLVQKVLFGRFLSVSPGKAALLSGAGTQCGVQGTAMGLQLESV